MAQRSLRILIHREVKSSLKCTTYSDFHTLTSQMAFHFQLATYEGTSESSHKNEIKKKKVNFKFSKCSYKWKKKPAQ